MRNYKVLAALSLVTVCQVGYPKTCAIDVNRIEVANVRIGQSDSDFLAQHPTAKRVVMPIDNYQIELADNTDEKLRRYGVTGVGHIGYQPKLHRISSFSLSFLEGGLATYDTNLSVFKNRILRKFNLPKNGWKKVSDTTYRYQCQDYVAEITQDYGAAHTAVGPTVMVFSRYMDDWKDWQK